MASGGAARRLFVFKSLTNQHVLMVFIIFLGGFLMIYLIIHSPFGEVLNASRDRGARDLARYKTTLKL